MATDAEQLVTPELERISLRQFLEDVHPNINKTVSALWFRHKTSAGISIHLERPDLRLHCETCRGPRTFRSVTMKYLSQNETKSTTLDYTCGDCQRHMKRYSLFVAPILSDSAARSGEIYKYGERPPFGVAVPNRVLRLFGRDADLFQKGRKCESEGLGIGAFAYYRRVVENHRTSIFDEIIKVCKMVGADQTIVDDLVAAKEEISFTKSMQKIRHGVPQGLLIQGQNPLTLLHSALSISLHGETDEECLQAAQDVRVVLTDLANRMSSLKQENSELTDSVKRLMKKTTEGH